MSKKCIGIDIGGTTVKLGLFEVDGTLIDKWEVPTRTEEGGKYILNDVAESILSVLKDREIEKEDVIGAGMGVPGPVSEDGYVEVCVNLGWKDINPQDEMCKLLGGIPVKGGNDANVAALGEMWQGGGKGYQDLVMLTLGTGVGGGVIINEEIVCGDHGLAGEIGHLPVRRDETEHCNCGGKGCLEQVSSATGIAREARRMMETTDMKSTLREIGDSVTAKDVLDAAKAEDPLALATMDTVAYYLGISLATITLIADPQVFVIGGGVSKAGSFLTDKIEAYYHEYTTISKKKAKITLAQLGNDAGIYGAARLVLE